MFNFYTFEGPCRKCGAGNNSIVYTGFTENKKNPPLSIFKLSCISCGNRSSLLAKDISEAANTVRKEIPPPTGEEPA